MGYCATVKASIDAAARANSSNDDDDDYAEYSYFGKLPNPDPKDLSPRDVCRYFISLFVGSRKSQAEYPKARKIKIFYKALTVEKCWRSLLSILVLILTLVSTVGNQECPSVSSRPVVYFSVVPMSLPEGISGEPRSIRLQ